MDLKTEIDLLQIKIKSNIENNEAEKLYYQALTLNELRKAHTTVTEGENLILLSPTNLTQSNDQTFQSGLHTGNPAYGAWKLFSADGRAFNTGYTGWWAINLKQKCVIHEYRVIFDHTNHVTPTEWSLEICQEGESTGGGDGDNWIKIDERSMEPSWNVTRTCKIISPQECQWVRFKTLASVDACTSTGTNQDHTLCRLEFYGKKITI